MDQSRREQFVNRLSSLGWGTRESIQTLLGSMVSDIRDDIRRGRVREDEIDAVVAFHDDAEDLWRATIASNPPIEVAELLARLRSLRDTCNAPVLAGFERRLDRGVRDAEALEQARK